MYNPSPSPHKRKIGPEMGSGLTRITPESQDYNPGLLPFISMLFPLQHAILLQSFVASNSALPRMFCIAVIHITNHRMAQIRNLRVIHDTSLSFSHHILFPGLRTSSNQFTCLYLHYPHPGKLTNIYRGLTVLRHHSRY